MSSEEMEVAETNHSENEDLNETEEMDEGDENGKSDAPKEVYLPAKQLEEGEELVCDKSVYVMYHQATTSSPCLSFDVIKDNLGDNRDTFPLTAYVVAGTQSPQAHTNNIIVMKLSNMHKTGKENDDDEEEDSDEEDEDEEKKPKMAGALIKHQGTVNRIRSTVYGEVVIAASWSELGKVNLWNLTTQLQAVDNDAKLVKYNKEQSNTVKPIYTFTGHQKEGFALDWCPTASGTLATGDCKRDIHIWKPGDNLTSWAVDQRPLVGHTDSVEDIQWSPNERSVLASCSVDKSIRIWDVRAAPNKACMLTADNAHESDVNVINWNKNEPFIVSGGDDGVLRVWDLRKFKDKTPLAIFKHHTAPIVSVEWHHTDAPVFASGGADNQIALWDLSVEKDAENSSEEVEGLPPQLLFIHQGQNDIKELHWHQQLPGVIISTAESGFNIFRTISV
ncbi:unnamed protein product [Phyllotreta striolata]|uniref:Glutamate-rich WD repeat-containing protein 1 n=1 Tax=Phyllotreta striolata TaxID=444603 RepID=A0A9N9TR41_PHYSR|nr:unnamed protein product [Phyllotreta striolata]